VEEKEKKIRNNIVRLMGKSETEKGVAHIMSRPMPLTYTRRQLNGWGC
jgi:hypothetical protein